MTIKIENANISPSQFVANSSRYADGEVIYWGDNRLLAFKTYKRNSYNFSPEDKFIIISKGLEYRVDKIAEKAYGRPFFKYWWKILEANNVKDIGELKAGKLLRIPSIA